MYRFGEQTYTGQGGIPQRQECTLQDCIKQFNDVLQIFSVYNDMVLSDYMVYTDWTVYSVYTSVHYNIVSGYLTV